jgi:hypothetical protein
LISSEAFIAQQFDIFIGPEIVLRARREDVESMESEAAIAMPPQEIPAEIKSWKAIADDKERLKCFDVLFGGLPKPQDPQEGKQRTGLSMRPNRLLMAVLGRLLTRKRGPIQFFGKQPHTK